MECKAKIDLKEGKIELEGSEIFVSKYLELFSTYLSQENKPQSDDSPEYDNQDISTTLKESDETSDKKVRSRKEKSPAKVKPVQIERFDAIASDNKPSLEEFFNTKKPGRSTGDIIAVMGYYITHIKEQPYFSEGNIDYGYRILSLKGRPKHLRQIIINNKNNRDLFSEAEDGQNWVLTRTGEIFVEEKLPQKEE